MNGRLFLTVVCLMLGVSVQAANNSWKAGSGKWEDSANWSLGHHAGHDASNSPYQCGPQRRDSGRRDNKLAGDHEHQQSFHWF